MVVSQLFLCLSRRRILICLKSGEFLELAFSLRLRVLLDLIAIIKQGADASHC
jgi:hypothetical protein